MFVLVLAHLEPELDEGEGCGSPTGKPSGGDNIGWISLGLTCLKHSGCHSYKEEESAAEGWMLVTKVGKLPF